jgi:hypothetical protein
MSDKPFPFYKPFSWSFSKLKNFETCPAKHYAVDLTKKFKEPLSPQLEEGNRVHKAFAERIGKGVPLPPELSYLEGWMERALKIPGTRLVEQQMAITATFEPCAWFGDRAWYRSISDLLILRPRTAHSVDYKTGRMKPDSQQLALNAACIFAHHKDIQAVRTEYWWLQEGIGEEGITTEDFKRADMASMWRNLWPRIEALKNAWDLQEYPPKPSGICKQYCPVLSCPHHGVGSRG